MGTPALGLSAVSRHGGDWRDWELPLGLLLLPKGVPKPLCGCDHGAGLLELLALGEHSGKETCMLSAHPSCPHQPGGFQQVWGWTRDWRWILVQGIATCFVLSDVQGQGLSHIFAQALGVDLVPLDKTPSVWGWKSSVLGPAEGCVPTGPHPESPVADSERHSLNSPRWWPRWLLGQPPMATQTALASGVDASLNH